MIHQALSGMIAIMMTKIMFNDVPHYLFEETTMRELKVTHVDDRLATGAQLHSIAIRTARLKIPEPVVKGFGEAGRMIRELEEEEKYRKTKKLKGGNPGLHGRSVPHDLEMLVPGEMTHQERVRRWFAYEDALIETVKRFDVAKSKLRQDALRYEWSEEKYKVELGKLEVENYRVRVEAKGLLKNE